MIGDSEGILVLYQNMPDQNSLTLSPLEASAVNVGDEVSIKVIYNDPNVPYPIPPVWITKTIESVNVTTGVVTLSSNPPIPTIFPTFTLTARWITTQSGSIRNGGGLRVASIEVDDGAGNILSTTYDYTDPNTNESSGITSYAPQSGSGFIPYQYEVPGPGVMYEYVTVEQKGVNNQSEGKMRYHFEVLDCATDHLDKELTLGNHFVVDDDETQGDKANDYYAVQFNNPAQHGSDDHIKRRVSTIHDRTSRLGRINSISQFSSTGVELSRTEYNYMDDDQFELGKVQETYSDTKVYGIYNGPSTPPTRNWLFTTTTKIKYPNYLTSVTNYSGGLETTTTFDQFDPFTRQPTVTTQVNGYGEQYRSEVSFLHTIPGYESMSSKVTNLSNQNILGPAAYSKSSVSHDNGQTWQPISASAQVWQDTWGYRGADDKFITETHPVWRPWKSYSWKGGLNEDGTYDNTFVDVDFSNLPGATPTASDWQQVSEIMQYDPWSHSLEARDLNDKYASTKLGYGNFMRTLASTSNAEYTEFAFSGAEDLDASIGYFGGGVEKIAGTLIDAGDYYNTTAHTGRYALQLSGTETGFQYHNNLMAGRTYRASVWVRTDGGALPPAELFYHVPPASPEVVAVTEESFRAGDWYLLTADIEVPGTIKSTISVRAAGGTVYVDDFRLHPVDAPFTSYVYDHWTGEVVAVLDNENIASRFQYDNAGRLVKTEQETREGFRRVTETTHNYQQPLE